MLRWCQVAVMVSQCFLSVSAHISIWSSNARRDNVQWGHHCSHWRSLISSAGHLVLLPGTLTHYCPWQWHASLSWCDRGDPRICFHLYIPWFELKSHIPLYQIGRTQHVSQQQRVWKLSSWILLEGSQDSYHQETLQTQGWFSTENNCVAKNGAWIYCGAYKRNPGGKKRWHVNLGRWDWNGEE